MRPSYVSLRSALAHHGLIPEHVPAVTSVTTSRPGRRNTCLGDFECRHIKTALFYGYRLEDMGGGQRAMVATPEKALFGLLYLNPGSDRPAYLQEPRLQNLDSRDLGEQARLAEAAGGPKLRRAVKSVGEQARKEAEEYEAL